MKERPRLTTRDVLLLAGISAGSILLLSGRDKVESFLKEASKTQSFENAEIPQLQVTTEATPTPEQPQKVEIMLTGDVMLGRSVMDSSLRRTDPTYPFRNVADVLRQADLVFINLENPVFSGCQRTSEFSVGPLCADPIMVEGLTYAGVDVANLANNHTLDYGAERLDETRRILGERGIGVTGVGELKEVTIGGTNFGFLGFNLTSGRITDEDLELVKQSNDLVDVLIVAVHWGQEYSPHANTFQRETAELLVEAGADVIAGSHPHVVQERETIDGKPAFFSLGNLVFDQTYEPTFAGLAVRLIFENGRLVATEELPTYMFFGVQPEFTK